MALNLPIIVGFGGVNAAGRSSFHGGYLRTVLDSLGTERRNGAVFRLAAQMNLIRCDEGRWVDSRGVTIDPSSLGSEIETQVREGTLIRKIPAGIFDADRVPFNQKVSLAKNSDKPLKASFANASLNAGKFNAWEQTSPQGESPVEFDCGDETEFLVPSYADLPIKAAGLLPDGFRPAELYRSHNHPAAIVYSIYGISDALFSLGLDWGEMTAGIPSDRIGVYASSSLGQLDSLAAGGYLRAALAGKKPSSKQLPFAFPEMAADFVNSYVLGHAGHTRGSVGACATFLYNLCSASEEIKSGQRDLALVGCSEAPILPEVLAGFHAMSALAEVGGLAKLDGVEKNQVDFRRSCRPFGENCGFVMGEGSQFLILASEELALEKGCTVHGSVGGVFLAGDGFKSSISKPGLGNYLSFFKCAALAKAMLGEDGLRQTFVQSHGTGTPQNRVSESEIFSKCAGVFGMEDWKITGVKSHLGHPLGPAGGDQIASALGTWAHGIIPGIGSTKEIAADVERKGLNFLLKNLEIDPEKTPGALINSKGFGGNNATGLILSPAETLRILEKKHGKKTLARSGKLNAKVREKAEENDESISKGELKPIYKADLELTDFSEIKTDKKSVSIPSHDIFISLQVENPYH